MAREQDHVTVDVRYGKVIRRKRIKHIQRQKVLELGSGPGLCGFVAAKLGAQQVVLTDYKRPVMELIGYNIKHY